MASSNPTLRNMGTILNGQPINNQTYGQPYNPQYGQPGAGTATAGAPDAAYLNQMYHQPAYGAMPARERFLTFDDVVMKTATVLGTAILVGALTAFLNLGWGMVIGGALVGFVLAMIITFKTSTNPALIMSYAVAEGVFLGGITAAFNAVMPGIALQAVVATVGVFVGMLVVYKTGAIRVTPKLTKMLIGAFIGVFVLMLFNLGFALFTGGLSPLRDGGSMAIIFSVVCIVLAALSFMMDFEAINQGVKQGAPAQLAWYFAFSLMVTLVWLYIEILRLLSYLNRN